MSAVVWAVVILSEVVVVLVYGRATYRQRLWNILIAVDQMGNAYLGGDPDETISSRAAKQAHKRGWRLLGRVLDKIDPGHMEKSIEQDRGDDAAWE